MSRKKTQKKVKYESQKPVFSIPQFIKIEGLRGTHKFVGTTPISPIFGRSTKNVLAPEHIIVKTVDVDQKYDSFRAPEDKKGKDYDKFLEFKDVVITAEDHEKYLGRKIYRPDEDTLKEIENPNEPKIIRPIGIEVKTLEKNDATELKTNFEKFNHLKSDQTFKKDIDNESIKEYDTFVSPPPIENDMLKPEVSEPIFVDSKPLVDDQEFSKPKEKPITSNKKTYQLPSVDIFSKQDLSLNEKPDWLLNQIDIINETLAQFNVDGKVAGSKKGPTVTRYEIELGQGVNVKKVSSLQDNFMMNLSSQAIRIEAPIPGKPYVGIEVPNDVPEIVAFGNVVDRPEFLDDHDHPLKVALGVDIDGKNIYADIQKMPHGLIAGATNSGKSVCVNTILVSLLLKNKPEDLKLILIDPKIVELSPYNGLPHLITPVITDAKISASALKWAVNEMEKRYREFANNSSRDITSYNLNIKNGLIDKEKMPYIVIVIDELADLIMIAPSEVEESIQRLTQKARAAGIHLLVATQRPTTDIVKGTIKSNIPTRIAFKVASFVDSTTILDGAGAETLLGKGDMLFKEGDQPRRLQGAFIQDKEIMAVNDFIRRQSEPNYIFEHNDLEQQIKFTETAYDEYFPDVARFVVRERSASINSLQKEFSIGFNRAQRLVDLLENYRIVSANLGTKAREVLVTSDELEEILRNN
jgi:S-DNA-T family DNA segregation ATPase FtsK/SpoIIIE